MNCKLTTPSSPITNPLTQSTRLHSHPTITNHHLSLTNPSSFYPSSSHSKHQPFSFRTNSLGGYNINFFDITKAQKYFKHNSSSKTPRFNLISKPPLITNPKTPLTKQQNMTSRNFSFSNNKLSKPSYIQIINKHKPITPKHNNATTTTTTVKNKHMYTPVYKKVNNQRYCSGSSNNNNKKLTSLSDNDINANGCNDNWGKEYKKFMTIAGGEKGKKRRKEKVREKDNNDDVVTADVISAKERRKAILNGEDLKRRRSDNAGGKNGDNNNNNNKMRKSNEIKPKHVGNSNSNKKKYLSINTNVTVNVNSNSSNKYISKTPKTKAFGLNNNNNNNKHITPNNNTNTNNNNNNNEYLYTDVLYSFNSITNTIGNQTQTHFKNKYRNLFETYFSSGAITTTCIPTSHI